MKWYIILIILLIVYSILTKIESFKDVKCVDNKKEDEFRKVLSYWSKFAKEYDLNYSISHGTLLGQVRNNEEFIGYDGDQDILINPDVISKLQKMGNDPKETRVILTKDLQKSLQKCPWKPNEIKILVLYKNYYIDCDGNRVNKYEGSCSLGIPEYGGAELYGRVILNNQNNRKFHLDLFSEQKYMPYLDEVEDCLLEGIQTKRMKNYESFLKEEYGDNWKIPTEVCNEETGKYIKNKDYPKK